MRRLVRTVSLFAAVVTFAVMGFVTYLNYQIPDSFYVFDTENFSMEQLPSVQADPAVPQESPAGTSTSRSRETPLKLLGIIPIKTTYLHEVDEQYVVPCGTPFGLKMLTDGVVVVGLNPVETAAGTLYPARDAGIRKGDVILKANGRAVSGNQDLTEQIRRCGGKSVAFTLRRGEAELTVCVTPAKASSDGEYRCGIWVRDSSAGIGTVTFYDPATGVFGGLGHAVCDVDTGETMPLSSGQVVPVQINGVRKGQVGTPGELQGSFLSSFACGSLSLNNETGVYGVLTRNPAPSREAVPLCLRQEVGEGPAQILTTVAGTTPELYDIVIEKVNIGDNTPTKNMVIRITDQRLLELTGGIVQGMSGSPILQKGRLAGAVTHVLVNDPTRGYGIFSENMLENSKKAEIAANPAA